MVADNHAVLIDAHELSIRVRYISIIQLGKRVIAINKPMRNSTAIPGVEVPTNNYAVVIEASRASLLGSRKVWDREECSIATALKRMPSSIAIYVTAEQRVEIIDSDQACAVMYRFWMND